MGRREELKAQIERLPWQKRAAIIEALARGRAVADEDLAPLAAAWAVERRAWTARLYLGFIGPLMILTVAIVLWLVSRNDPDSSVGAMLFAAFTALGIMTLIVWAGAWRPLVRSEKANLAKAGVGAPPSKREPSHWVTAWLIAWPIASIVGLGVRALGVSPGPVGVVVWVGLLWAVKRGLDSREFDG
ncbi:MAG: hypothetical protein WKF86_05205 [Acidimicrobiales bacterium]